MGYWLQTERLAFGRWSESDLPLARRLWGDPEVTSRIGGPFTQQQIADRLACEVANLRSHGIQYWPIFLRASGDLAGCCGLKPFGDDPRVLETGFHLRPAYWGQGLAEEAARAVIRHAFEQLGVASLFAGHHPDNDASRRLLLKLGFRLKHRELYPPTGLEHLCYVLSPKEPQ